MFVMLFYIKYRFDYFYFFFFKHKTAYEMLISDCSSDVCSSDLIISPLRIDHCLSGLLQCFSGAVAASTWRAYSGHNIWRSHSAHFVQHVLLVGAGCYGAFALVRGGPIAAAAQKQDGQE